MGSAAGARGNAPPTRAHICAQMSRPRAGTVHRSPPEVGPGRQGPSDFGEPEPGTPTPLLRSHPPLPPVFAGETRPHLSHDRRSRPTPQEGRAPRTISVGPPGRALARGRGRGPRFASEGDSRSPPVLSGPGPKAEASRTEPEKPARAATRVDPGARGGRRRAAGRAQKGRQGRTRGDGQDPAHAGKRHRGLRPHTLDASKRRCDLKGPTTPVAEHRKAQVDSGGQNLPPHPEPFSKFAETPGGTLRPTFVRSRPRNKAKG